MYNSCLVKENVSDINISHFALSEWWPEPSSKKASQNGSGIYSPLLSTKGAAKLKRRAGCLQVWERGYKILGIVNTTSMSTCIKYLYIVCHSELQLHANVLERVIVFLPVEHRWQILHPHCSSIITYCKNNTNILQNPGLDPTEIRRRYEPAAMETFSTSNPGRWQKYGTLF